MKLPIGYDDFGAVKDNQLDLIDKSLLIKELLDDASQIVLITRPRRFGKTLNLSMLHYFFAPQVKGKTTAGLFNNLKIAQYGEKYLQHQGKYPVIFISFKDIKDHSFEHAYKNLANLISRIYEEHEYVIASDKLTAKAKEQFTHIIQKQADEVTLQESLMRLCYYLYQYHGVKPWLLIDEYDTPLQAAYIEGYLPEQLAVMGGMFSRALKNNSYLHRAAMTGILQIAKQNLFSDINNIKIYSILQPQYSDYFGFTEAEMLDILQDSGLTAQSDAIRAWYNGYQIGNTVLYNPWSIANCIYEKGALRPYWVATSSNLLIKKLLARADSAIKKDLETLLSNQAVTAVIHTNTLFEDLDKDASALYSLLLLSGYLKTVTCYQVDADYHCSLIVPNQEVMALYRSIIKSWFSEAIGFRSYERFLSTLIAGQVAEFTHILQDFLLESLSVFDVKGTHPEIFYHGFVLGMMISLKDSHEVCSNQESGYGRYDVMLIPKDTTALGIILEFKTVRHHSSDLHQAAQAALQQITEGHYIAKLQQRGIHQVLMMGLAFRGKEVIVLATDSAV